MRESTLFYRFPLGNLAILVSGVYDYALQVKDKTITFFQPSVKDFKNNSFKE